MNKEINAKISYSDNAQGVVHFMQNEENLNPQVTTERMERDIETSLLLQQDLEKLERHLCTHSDLLRKVMC
jgi:hypothetical protein